MSRNGVSVGTDEQFAKYDNGKSLFNRLSLSSEVLGRPFYNLNNQDLRELALVLDRI